MNYGEAIQNKLVELASTFPFPVYRYQPSKTGQQRCLTGQIAKAAAAIAWEESTVFGEPVHHRRTSDRRERLTWTWRLHVQFNASVSLEEFEALLVTDYPVIPRDPTNGLDRQVDLLLEDAEYQNPVTQQAAQGTRVTYRFTAQLSPT